MRRAEPAYLKGATFGLLAAAIWASWSAVTRLAVTTSLAPWDIAALRFGVAGLLLAPVVVRRGFAIERLGWAGLGAIIAGLGAPYALLAAGGLHFAPASDRGALNPGCMPLFVALIAAPVLGESISIVQRLGLVLILAGALIIIGRQMTGWNSLRVLGDALLLSASLLSACFTVTMRRAKLDPLHAAALVSTGSMVLYLPIYFAACGTHLAQIPAPELLVQAFFQGVVVTIISVVLYGRAIVVLGAPGASAFGALVPPLSAVFAIPLLREWPTRTDWLAIILISVGVYLASGGLKGLPRRKRHGLLAGSNRTR